MNLTALLPRALAYWFASVTCFAQTIIDRLQCEISRLRQLFLVLALRLRGQPPRRYRCIAQAAAVTIRRIRAKPEWVKHEVQRLKALMPHGTYRKITDCFNRRFGFARKMTVGKIYVSETIRKHLYEIQVLRKQIKNAKPKSVPVNWVWGMDLTGKTDSQSKLHMPR